MPVRCFCGNPAVWYQAYLSGDPDEATAMVDRVAAAGIDTLVITADSAVVPSRENNLRNGYRSPIRPNLARLRDGLTHPRWSLGTFLRTFVHHGVPHFENAGPGRGAPLLSRRAVRDFSGREGLNWDVVRLVRSRFRGRLVLKGLLHPADIALAREASFCRTMGAGSSTGQFRRCARCQRRLRRPAAWP